MIGHDEATINCNKTKPWTKSNQLIRNQIDTDKDDNYDYDDDNNNNNNNNNNGSTQQ